MRHLTFRRKPRENPREAAMYHILDYIIISTSTHVPIPEFCLGLPMPCRRYSKVFDVFRKNYCSSHVVLDVSSLFF